MNPSWLREILMCITHITAHTPDTFPSFFCVLPHPLWLLKPRGGSNVTSGGQKVPFLHLKMLRPPRWAIVIPRYRPQLVFHPRNLIWGGSLREEVWEKSVGPNLPHCAVLYRNHSCLYSPGSLQCKVRLWKIHIKTPQGTESEGWTIVLKNTPISALCSGSHFLC